MKTPLINRRALLIVAMMLVVLAGCVKDEGRIARVGFDADIAWGLPIATARLSAKDAIDHFDTEGIVQSDGSGQVRIVYVDTLKPLGINDLLQFPDQQLDAEISLSNEDFNVLLGEGSIDIEEQRIFQFNSSENDRLDSLRFSGGNFSFQVLSNAGFNVGGTLSLHNAETGQLLYSATFEPSLPPLLINLSGFLNNVLLTFPSQPAQANAIEVRYALTLNYEGSISNAPIDISLRLTDFGLRSIGGYIAPRSLELDSEGLNVSMFDDVPQGQIRIEDPRFNFFVSNEVGIGARLDVGQLIGVNRAGEVLEVPGSNIDPFPTLAPAPAPGEFSTTLFTVNNDRMTPSVTDFLAHYPNFINGDFTLSINPDDEQSAFVSADAEIGLRYDVEVPIFGSIADFFLEDTTAVGLGALLEDLDEEELTELIQLDLGLFVQNGLPVDASVQLLLLDSLGQQVDALFSDDLGEVLRSAPVNLGVPPDHPEYGRAMGSSATQLLFELPRERVFGLKPVSQMVVRVSAHTASNGNHPIRIYENDAVGVQLNARIKLRIDV